MQILHVFVAVLNKIVIRVASRPLFRVYLGVRTCDIFLCFEAYVFLLCIVFDALCCFVRSLFYVTVEPLFLLSHE